jgi:uncharacterized protein
MDDLTAPLGQSRAAGRRLAAPAALSRALALALGLGLALLVFVWVFVDGLPSGSEPTAVTPAPAPRKIRAETAPAPAPRQVQAETAPAPAPRRVQTETTPTPAPRQVQAETPVVQPRPESDAANVVREPTDAGGRRTVTIIDGMSGRRQEVVIGLPEPAPSAAPGQRSR